MNEDAIVRLEVTSVLAGSSVTLGGRTYSPDQTKAYFEFQMANAFPNRTEFGTAIHPQTLANSYKSMEHGQVDLYHLVKALNPDKIVRDRIVGSVVGVELAGGQAEGQRRKGAEEKWKVQGDPKTAPGIRGVGVIHKMAEGVDRVLGGHQSGKRKMGVSMEAFAPLAGSGFLVNRKMADEHRTAEGQRGKGAEGIIKDLDGLPCEATPDLVEMGYSYVPYGKAPDDLRELWNTKKNVIEGPFKGCEVLLLQGGIDGEVHFAGLGFVDIQMEKSAELIQIAAGEQDAWKAAMGEFAQYLEKFGEAFEQELRVES